MTMPPDEKPDEKTPQDLLGTVTEPDTSDEAAENIEEVGEPFMGNNA